MREVLRCARALLSEWRLPEDAWPRVIKLVQVVLNHSPSPSLDGVAPITAMTGLPVVNPLDPIAVPGDVEFSTIDAVRTIRNANFARLRDALGLMHKRLAAAKQTARKKGRAKAVKRGAKMA